MGVLFVCGAVLFSSRWLLFCETVSWANTLLTWLTEMGVEKAADVTGTEAGKAFDDSDAAQRESDARDYKEIQWEFFDPLNPDAKGYVLRCDPSKLDFSGAPFCDLLHS